MSEWKTLSLEDCMAAIIDYRGKSPDKTTFGIPLVTAKIVKGGRIEKPEEFIAEADFDEWMRRGMPKPGDIVMTTEAPLGEVAQLDGRKVALAQRVITLRGKPDVLDNTFLKFLLQSNPVQEELRSRGTGTTVVGIRQSELRKVSLTLPPLAEQKAIAAVLGALDDKIELNRRMNATLEAMARALFQSWFVDFDPVRAKLDGRPPAALDPATAALFPEHLEDSKLGHVPKGWEVVGLPEAIDFLEGPGLRNWQYRDEGMKFLNIRCIGDGDLDIAKANCISLEEFEKTYRHFALQEDDIVISTSGTLGRLAIVRADHLPVMLNTSIIRMRGRGAVGLGYLWGFLQSEYFLAEMFALAAGSVQLNFGPMHLRQISILRPPDGILEGFERAVQPLLKKCLHLRNESRTLATLRDTLLPKLLSGELSVAGEPLSGP